MARKTSRGNTPGENQDGSRSFKPYRKFTRRPIPKALFARPVENKEPDTPETPHTPDPVEALKARSTRQAVRSEEILQRNKKFALVISATHSVGFLTPIWVIFGTDHLHLSLLLSLILGSTGWVTSSLFEVPLGAFADKYGRQISLVSGLALCALGDLTLVVFKNFWLLMFFQLIAGMGFAMRSGSLEGLLHDTYEASGETTIYAKLSSQMLFLVSVSRIMTVPIGAWLYQLSPKASLSSFTYPYIATVCAYVIALFAAGMLTEKRSSKKEVDVSDLEQGKIASRLWVQTIETWQEMMANRDVKRVTITLGLYAFIGEGNWALYQTYFRHRHIALTDSSWIYAVLVFLMAMGSLYVANVYKKINVMWAMNIMIAITTFDIVLMHLPIYLAFFAFALSAFIGSMSWYLQDNAIQNRMSGDRKTTALSIASTVYNIGAMLGIFGIGAIAEHIGVLQAQWLFVLYGAVVVAGIAAWTFSDGIAVRPEDARATGTEMIAPASALAAKPEVAGDVGSDVVESASAPSEVDPE